MAGVCRLLRLGYVPYVSSKPYPSITLRGKEQVLLSLGAMSQIARRASFIFRRDIQTSAAALAASGSFSSPFRSCVVRNSFKHPALHATGIPAQIPHTHAKLKVTLVSNCNTLQEETCRYPSVGPIRYLGSCGAVNLGNVKLCLHDMQLRL